MKTLARTLLLWFVLLAIPFQGFAAAALTCAHGSRLPVREGLRHGDYRDPGWYKHPNKRRRCRLN